MWRSAGMSGRWGSAFPRTSCAALVAAQPEKFFMPIASDLRYNWVRVWLDAIDTAEMRELVVDAWHMVVPKRIAADYLRDHPLATARMRSRPSQPVAPNRVVASMRRLASDTSAGAASPSAHDKRAIALVAGRENVPGAGPGCP